MTLIKVILLATASALLLIPVTCGLGAAIIWLIKNLPKEGLFLVWFLFTVCGFLPAAYYTVSSKSGQS